MNSVNDSVKGIMINVTTVWQLWKKLREWIAKKKASNT